MFEFHSDWKVIVNSIPFLRYLVLFSDMRTFSEDEGKEEANKLWSRGNILRQGIEFIIVINFSYCLFMIVINFIQFKVNNAK